MHPTLKELNQDLRYWNPGLTSTDRSAERDQRPVRTGAKQLEVEGNVRGRESARVFSASAAGPAHADGSCGRLCVVIEDETL
eukprot:48926-Rhodomonas_salina.1